MIPETQQRMGLFPRLRAFFLGSRAARLTERASRTHWLSYLLIISQSIAVVLVFGHAEVGLLLATNLAIRAMALMALFVLVITVIAADLALLETLTRIPALARNRQGGMLWEHLLYVLFVLCVEGSTYGVVLAALDRDPQALVQGRSLIPTDGWIFLGLVIMRVMLICWSAVQLIIVRGKLPVLLSTLTNTGKEIVGAHVEHQLAGLDIGGVKLPDTFRLYAAMARPPRRIRGWFNTWLVDREMAAEAEEERQVSNVVNALEELERRRAHAASPEPPMPLVTITPDDEPPTGPGTPITAPAQRLAAASVRTDDTRVLEYPSRPRRQNAARGRAARSNGRPVRTAVERVELAAEKRTQRLAQVGAWLAEDPAIATRELVRRLQTAEHSRISESTVTSLRREVEAGLNPVPSGQQFAQ